jgi:flavorubredoxin
MVREITEGIYWLQGDYVASVGDDAPAWHDTSVDLHSPINAYLIVGERSLLFDTLSPADAEETVRMVRETLDGQSLDYIAPSHGESPHAGNTHVLGEAFPEAEVLAPAKGDLHDHYYLGDATRVQPGLTRDLGGKTVEFVAAPFIDTGMHTWLFERTTRTLFVVDWLAFPHDETECMQFVDEMDRTDEELERMMWLSTGHVFAWFEFVDTDKTEAMIEYLAERYAPEILAPAHGQVIREDADRYLEMMKDVMAEHSEGHRPTLV